MREEFREQLDDALDILKEECDLENKNILKAMELIRCTKKEKVFCEEAFLNPPHFYCRDIEITPETEERHGIGVRISSIRKRGWVKVSINDPGYLAFLVVYTRPQKEYVGLDTLKHQIKWPDELKNKTELMVRYGYEQVVPYLRDEQVIRIKKLTQQPNDRLSVLLSSDEMRRSAILTGPSLDLIVRDGGPFYQIILPSFVNRIDEI